MFGTHLLNDHGLEEMRKFKTEMSEAVSLVASKMADSREKSLFLTKVEEAVFFGAKAIAMQPINHSDSINYPEKSHSVK